MTISAVDCGENPKIPGGSRKSCSRDFHSCPQGRNLPKVVSGSHNVVPRLFHVLCTWLSRGYPKTYPQRVDKYVGYFPHIFEDIWGFIGP